MKTTGSPKSGLTLEARELISRGAIAGKKIFLVHDPRVALEKMAEAGDLSSREFSEANDLLIELKQKPMEPKTGPLSQQERHFR